MHGSLQRLRVPSFAIFRVDELSFPRELPSRVVEKAAIKAVTPGLVDSWIVKNRVLKIPATFDLHFEWMKKIVTIIKPFREIAYRQSWIYPCCASHNGDKVAINCLEKEKEITDKARRE